MQPCFSFIKHFTPLEKEIKPVITICCILTLIYVYDMDSLTNGKKACTQVITTQDITDIFLGQNCSDPNLPPSAQPVSSFLEISTPRLLQLYFLVFLSSCTICNATLNNIIVCLESSCMYFHVCFFST